MYKMNNSVNDFNVLDFLYRPERIEDDFGPFQERNIVELLSDDITEFEIMGRQITRNGMLRKAVYEKYNNQIAFVSDYNTEENVVVSICRILIRYMTKILACYQSDDEVDNTMLLRASLILDNLDKLVETARIVSRATQSSFERDTEVCMDAVKETLERFQMHENPVFRKIKVALNYIRRFLFVYPTRLNANSFPFNSVMFRENENDTTMFITDGKLGI